MVLGFKKQFVDKILHGSKIHTIREDKTRRWKKGNEIHFATGVRTKDYTQFKGDFCTNVQRVHLHPKQKEIYLERNGGMHLIKDNQKFARNDGFDTEEDFWNWFNYPFRGVMISWTQHQYD